MTAGTPERAAHRLAGQGLRFRLAEEENSLRAERGHTSGGRAAKSLAKSRNLRVTLVRLDAGVTLEPEAVAGGASLQILSGRLRVQVDEASFDAETGDLLVFSDNLREPIRAVEDASFLVTVAWPQGAGAWEQEAAAGHL
jgi:quercetin dioxygenase-like cupin family protein